MSCESCYSGCVQTVADECVRYTGPGSLALEIQTGDSLAVVEQRLIEYLTSCLDGTGINVAIDPGIICPLVQAFLPVTPDCIYTVPEYLTALTRTACALKDATDVLGYELSRLQGIYNVNCLVGVLPTDGTLNVLQATINKLCQTSANLTTLSLDVNTNYVKISDLNSLIQAYLEGQAGSITQQYRKMVPYTVVEYYGPLTNFDGSGAGIQSLGWDKVYLCNGANGTPDKRGRATVGAVKNVPGGPPLSPVVDPLYAGNPNYDKGDVTGSNTVGLTVNNLPSHNHSTQVIQSTSTEANGLIVDPGHSHFAGQSGNKTGEFSGSVAIHSTSNTFQTTTSKTGISVTTNVGVNINNTGLNEAHPNIQPVIAAYYIMYIP
jgi:microcystin-dependent protein